MWQKQMFDAFVEGVWEIPTEWDVICRRLAHFAWVVLEGSDTFLYPASGAPFVEPDSLEVYFAMRKHLAERMLEKHGNEAYIGTQSFRALEQDEKIDPENIPEGWMKGETHWGEAAMPLKNVYTAMDLPRADACGVHSKKEGS